MYIWFWRVMAELLYFLPQIDSLSVANEMFSSKRLALLTKSFDESNCLKIYLPSSAFFINLFHANVPSYYLLKM